MTNQILEQIKNSNKKYIIGVDECGTGSLCGDVYVSAFMAEKDWFLEGLNDSKKLSAKKREDLYTKLKQGISTEAFGYGYSIVNCHPNDKNRYKYFGDNLHGVLKFLYTIALKKLFEDYPSYFEIREDILVVLDGNIKLKFRDIEVISLPKADGLISQVMAASIMGKVKRDIYIVELGKQYPNYGWEKNKGYPTADHLEALKKFGYCEEHRLSYEPIKSMIK